MDELPNQKDTRDFLRLAKWGTGISFGALTGSLWAMDISASGFRFKFTWGVIPAALLGVFTAFIYWRLLQKLMISKEERATAGAAARASINLKKFAGFTALLFVATLLALLYPLRFAPSEKHLDIAFGMVLAFVCIAGVARVVWWLKKVLDEDDKHNRR